MKAAFFDFKEDVLSKKEVRKQLKCKVDFFEEPLQMLNLDKAKPYEIISGFISSHLSRDMLLKLPKLKLIVTRSTGYDHIDIPTCKERGVMVCNIPYYGENTVAEHAFALLLAVSRNVHKSYMRTQQNNFSIDGLKGFDLQGKTIGIIGLGNIGMHVARIARGFGMKVLAFDLHHNAFISDLLSFEYTDMNTLLKQADVITLHVPYNKHTHHLLDKKAFKKMKKGVVLINTARGGIIDTDALLWALDKGIVGGAGLDVIEGEELIKEEKELLHKPKKNQSKLQSIVKDHVLFTRDNVVYTPHIAFYSDEALQRILETTIENVNEFVAGTPRCVVMP